MDHGRLIGDSPACVAVGIDQGGVDVHDQMMEPGARRHDDHRGCVRYGVRRAGAGRAGSDPATTMAHDMAMMGMGDASPSPAYERADADLATGAFASLPGVTPGDIGGTAWLARHDGERP